MSLLGKFFSKKTGAKPTGYLATSDRSEIARRWSEIDDLVSLKKPSASKQAVIEADKMVDYALDKLFPDRQGAAERLKDARELFSGDRAAYEDLWYAHKIRNELVHSVGFEIPTAEADRVVGFFKTALERIGGL